MLNIRRIVSTMASRTMKAVRMHEAGPPESLKVDEIPIPTPSETQVLIKVKAFGLNRSEMFTRQGHSPGLHYPRVLGIEATGVVEEAPGGQFKKGTVVATCMGGMGRDFDGGYAEYTCVPAAQVQAIPPSSNVSWEQIGAAPEMLQTAYGSLFASLNLQKGDRLLIRGGTTSIGLAAASLAKSHGCYVASTTRRSDTETEKTILDAGADKVIFDDGQIATQLNSSSSTNDNNKFDKLLELIGTVTLRDSLRCVRQGGIVCNTGIAGNSWTLNDVNPMDLIPSTVCLTVYAGGPDEWMKTPIAELIRDIEQGRLKIPLGRVYHGLESVVEAHRVMEDGKAGGKIVVVLD